jgi:endo-1,4-beta-xylanase
MEYLEPNEGKFDFANADQLMKFSEQHGDSLHGHVLIWGEQIPHWLNDRRWSRSELTAIMKTYIQTVVTHYKGRIKEWDVVNEPLADDGTLKDNIWLYTLGPDYIEQALRFAHEADPDLKLYINERKAEFPGVRATAFEGLVRGLKKKVVQLNGVGFLMHWDEGPAPPLADVVAGMQRFTILGLELQVTEMDIGIEPAYNGFADHKANQQAQFAVAARACNALVLCTRFTVWGVGDKKSWRGASTTPLLLDYNYAEKPAYWSVRNAFAPWPR